MEVDLRRLLGQAAARADRHGREPGAIAAPARRTQRIVVLGVSGSGKTTLATRLGDRYIDMNALLDGSPADVRARFDEAAAAGTWAADASLQKILGDHVLERADTIVWLDLPLGVSLRRLWRRSRRDGESPFGPAWGAIRAHYSNRRRFPPRLERFEHVVQLRTRRAVEAWLAETPGV